MSSASTSWGSTSNQSVTHVWRQDTSRVAGTDDPARFDGVAVIGVDEHAWRPAGSDRNYTPECEEPN